MHLHVLLQVLPHTVYSEIADIKISRKVPFDSLLVVFFFDKVLRCEAEVQDVAT